jgi:branched-chain amino acid transport system permease protein
VALAIGHIDPDVAYWTTSGEFLFVTVLAGPGHVLAAVLGTGVFEVIRTYANQYAPHFWQLILGTSLVLAMLFLPEGLWSLAERLRRVKEAPRA